MSAKSKHVCGICSWIYDPKKGDDENGIEEGTAFEDIAEDWLCPSCGAPKQVFDEIE